MEHKEHANDSNKTTTNSTKNYYNRRKKNIQTQTEERTQWIVFSKKRDCFVFNCQPLNGIKFNNILAQKDKC